MPYKSKEERKKQYWKNPEKHRTECRHYYHTHKESIRQRNKRYRDNHKTVLNEYCRRYHAATKMMVLTYYGNGKPVCVLCGYSIPAALSIDHIRGGGAKHRREYRLSSGSAFYRWLVQNDFPDGFRTLCMNCQMIEKEKLKNVC